MEMIDAERIRSSLSMAQCVDAMEIAMIAVTERTQSVPPRLIMPLVDGSAYLAVMPGSLSQPLVYGAKILSLHPTNLAAGRPSIQGFVALFDHGTGEPVALVDGAEITAMRTAAASGLATRILSRADASSLGLFGYGVQAVTHLEAICAVRDIDEVRIWGRSGDRTRAFVAAHEGFVRAKLVAVDDPRDAATCDIVCTLTGAAEPILHGEWLRPGTHVNLVGSHSPRTREVDTGLMQSARIYVDSVESAFNEAGDILIPIEEGAINRSHVLGEIGAVLLGNLEGRTNDADITVYKSLGIVTQDLVAADAVYRNWLSAKAALPR